MRFSSSFFRYLSTGDFAYNKYVFLEIVSYGATANLMQMSSKTRSQLSPHWELTESISKPQQVVRVGIEIFFSLKLWHMCATWLLPFFKLGFHGTKPQLIRRETTFVRLVQQRVVGWRQKEKWIIYINLIWNWTGCLLVQLSLRGGEKESYVACRIWPAWNGFIYI